MQPDFCHRSRTAIPHILVADDAPVSRHLTQNWLNDWGFKTVLAEDGIEAWKILHSECAPSLLILNHSMPRMSGLELCQRLRAESRGSSPYIIMVAPHNDRNEVISGFGCGADQSVAKPLDPDELRVRINAGLRILAMQADLNRQSDELRLQATQDGLTGIWNRTAFLELFERELHRAGRFHDMTGLLLIDVDRFKRTNDTYGHLAGDVVLKEIARRLSQNLRTYDYVGRYGGEEFLIAVPRCSMQQLHEQAERVRLAICGQLIRVGTTEIATTVSIGAAVASPDERSTEKVIAAADFCLYEAKKAGRNRTVCFDASRLEDRPSTKQRGAARSIRLRDLWSATYPEPRMASRATKP